MQMNFFEADAIIFSLVNAPPPPLIASNLVLTSSAPSTYTSGPPTSFNSASSYPASFNKFELAIELQTKHFISGFSSFKTSIK